MAWLVIFRSLSGGFDVVPNSRGFAESLCGPLFEAVIEDDSYKFLSDSAARLLWRWAEGLDNPGVTGRSSRRRFIMWSSGVDILESRALYHPGCPVCEGDPKAVGRADLPVLRYPPGSVGCSYGWERVSAPSGPLVVVE